MGRYKYYMSYQHDHEECMEGNNIDYNYHKFVNKDGSELTDEQDKKMEEYWSSDDLDGYYKYQDNFKYIDFVDEYSKRSGEKLIIRVQKNGKQKGTQIVAHMCDFVEHFRERIKAPKGYLKRMKQRERNK